MTHDSVEFNYINIEGKKENSEGKRDGNYSNLVALGNNENICYGVFQDKCLTC